MLLLYNVSGGTGVLLKMVMCSPELENMEDIYCISFYFLCIFSLQIDIGVFFQIMLLRLRTSVS